MRLSLIALAASAAAVVVAAHSASASPITAGSQVSFTGGADPLGGSSVYNSTGLDFRTSGAASVGTPGSLSLNADAAGVFAQLNAYSCPAAVAGGCGTIADLLMYVDNSTVLVSPALPIDNFITFAQNGLTGSFDLTSFRVTEIEPVAGQLGSIVVSGFGDVHFTGYTSTIGTMTLSAQGPGATSFSGSITAGGIPVPEPSTMLLLGAGSLVAMATIRRRQNRAV